ncbi:hypothetical protein [Aequorivita sp. CIP111184]|uniref:hypothetical protein n=1 Tax=Aequorivita sp. CIP111184 TaxID=2211356 RepID=UPI000DBC1C1F|nr:hypothetical protein [Aequorivita sp. CIP111184]SRX55283.1 hypothetical protein AEQU1_02305 [Aequorivita sp. CIP111184]
MEQTEFLEKNIFTDLKNLNDESEKDTVQIFSESEFETVLERVEHFGIGVYKIESWHNGETSEVAAHDDFKKKATDPKWYKKAFLTFKSRQPGLSYSATYKVSNKLLAKQNTLDDEELS